MDYLEKLNNVLSLYPIVGRFDKDLDNEFKRGEEVIDKILDVHEWGGDLDASLDNFDEYMSSKEGCVLNIHTPDWKFLFDVNPAISKPTKIKGGQFQAMNTTFYTWDEIKLFILQWKKNKFDYKDAIGITPSLNRTFRVLKIFKTDRGYLVSNQFDVTYPEQYLMANVLFSKENEISRDDNKERGKKEAKPKAKRKKSTAGTK